jgi:hypothetical protein
MDLGVQRLDAAVHHLGKAGEIGDVHHRQPGFAQRLGGAAGRDQFDAVARERLAEFDEAGLVRHRKEGAGDLHVGHHDSLIGPIPPGWTFRSPLLVFVTKGRVRGLNQPA